MKIGAVQLRPVAGDVTENITKHLEFIELAAARGADLVFFPELSLTGYEPQLARSLAMDKADTRLDIFQSCSAAHNLIIGLGMPIAIASQVQIGMVWFTPHKPRRSYAKQQLHADEQQLFVAGDTQLVLEAADHRLAPAICYESLQPDHAESAAKLGANVYLASVAKSAGGIAKAMQHYPAIARKHHLSIIMANAVGPCDNFISAGQSAAWGRHGELLTQMDDESAGLLLVDTLSGKTRISTLQCA